MTTAPASRPSRHSFLPDRVRRVAVLLTVALAIAVAVIATTSGSAPYTVHARFQNAGQMVNGGLVQVAGVKIGTVKRVSLADSGEADVEMEVTDERFVPFRQGTRATIRSVGQATLTNRYVAISPAPNGAPEIPSGAVLHQEDTVGIVDLDAILSSVDPRSRRDIQRLFARADEVYAGSGAPAFNRMLAKLEPAMAEVDRLAAELVHDRDALRRLIQTGSAAARAVASRRPSLDRAVVGTATAFRAVADERVALGSALELAPAVLRQARGTVGEVARTASALRPTLRLVPPPQAELRLLLRRAPKALDRFTPVIRRVNELWSPLGTALDGVPPLGGPAVEALKALGPAAKDLVPILEGLRFYGTDALIGVVNGLLTIASGQYNELGHYVKLEFVQNIQTVVNGALGGALLGVTKITGGLVPGVFNVTPPQMSRCPGGAVPPAPDGSNPWLPREGLCDPKQSMSALVNSPTAFCRHASDCEGDKRPTEFDLPARKPGEDGGIAAARTPSGRLEGDR
ncbi:MAG: MlaD family protein [Solirubrobacteraceae bacterium]